MVAKSNLTQPTNNSYVDSWDVPVNANFGYIDSGFGGSTTSISLAAANYTLSSSEVRNLCILISGTLSANRTLTFPALSGFWIINNTTTAGIYTITAQTGVGNTLIVPPGGLSIIYGDATNMYLADSAGVPASTNYTAAVALG
jgi:hypothetical protein